MDTIIATIFTENGIVYGLFLVIVLGVLHMVYKFITYMAPILIVRLDKYLQTIVDTFHSEQESSRTAFNSALSEISINFLKQIEESNSWHKRHNDSLKSGIEWHERHQQELEKITQLIKK